MGLQIDSDVPNCSECGALSHDGLTCIERLHGLLALEQVDSDLQSLHFLTVAAYNIQHPAQYTDHALAGLRKSFSEYLDDQITIEGINECNQSFSGPKRVLKPAFERQIVLRVWDMTIADVCNPFENHGTAERVKKWAQAIRREM
jgi:hypothetical protein